MKGFSKFWMLSGDKGHSHGQVVFTHRGLEIGKGLVFGLGLFCSPVHEQADDQTSEHSQYPQGVGAADPAAVVIERDVQALMRAVFDSPGFAVGFEPLRRGKLFGGQVGDEPNGFVFASDMLPG